MTSTNGEAGAPDATGTAGQNGAPTNLNASTDSSAQPTISSLISVLADLWPAAIVREPWRPHKPLRRGVHLDLLGVLTKVEVSRVLAVYCRRRMYLAALAAGGPRYGLAGDIDGEVTADEAERARVQMANLDAENAKAVADAREARRASARKQREWARPKEAHDGAEARYVARKAAERRKPAPLSASVQPQKTNPEPSPEPRRLSLADLRRAHAQRTAGEAPR